MRHLQHWPVVLVMAALVVSCQPAQEAPAETEAPKSQAQLEETPQITLTALGASPQYPDAGLALDSWDTENGFQFSVEGYELGAQTADAAEKGIANSGQGQHIHLIIDNGPYSAHYTPEAAVELEPGTHTVLAFLSRSYHESVKSPGAAVLTQVTVGEEAEDGSATLGALNAFDPEGPHLFYSRPKGTYTGADTERLMLDFYLVNTDLAPDGNRVRATINGAEFLIDTWQPYVIEGLELGEVEIELELIDSEGDLIPGPFNRAVRSVQLAPAGED